MKFTLLLVEDDEGLRPSLERAFQQRGNEVLAVATRAEAARMLSERKIDLVLADIRLPDGSGLGVLADAHEIDDEILVILMTAFPEVKSAVAAMKSGARDFIVKPFELEELYLTVDRAIESRQLRRKVSRLERETRDSKRSCEILGKSPAIQRIRDEIAKVAATDTPVLITGETGTGKELVADNLHRLSERRTRPLIKVNCSAFSEQLLESELFGHEKGAFTDAKTTRAGLFEMSEGGTLFLDEISELKSALQAKLLRIVEGQPFYRVGGQREISTSVRVVAATNRHLPDMVAAGSFREDLYFRLNVFQIRMPPLGEREDDVVLLANKFLEHSAEMLRKNELSFDRAAEDMLLAYDWPGNVRELRNVVERAAILCENRTVGVENLPKELQASAFVRRHAVKGSGAMPSLAEIERRYIAAVLENTDGNISEAARIIGISRNTLKAKLRLPAELSSQG